MRSERVPAGSARGAAAATQHAMPCHAMAASNCSIMHSEQGSALRTPKEVGRKIISPNVKDFVGQVAAIREKWFPDS